MKNLFHVLPTDFLKPLTSKYKIECADCILLIFNLFKPEISYGVNREEVVKVLEEYFETDDNEMTFDEQTYIRDAREKANATLPESTITRAEAKNAFYELREQAADVPEMSLDEINAEISAVRAERKR